MTAGGQIERLYTWITEEDEGDTCEGIPEEACRQAPNNFFMNSLNGTATKLADQLASPGLVLPWFLDVLGAPGTIIGFVTPIRKAGALLFQLAIAGRIRRLSLRKWPWMVGGLGFGLALLLMVPVGLTTSGLTAGALVLGLLALGSLARGLSSVAFKDVLAKTIPRGKRGMLLAVRATLGGILALAAGLYLRLQVDEGGSVLPYVILIAAAGVLWILSALLVAFISEDEGATGGARHALEEAKEGVVLLEQNRPFRRYLLARSVLLSVEISLPYYALFARRLTGGRAEELGIFIIAASVSQVLSSPFWGRFADRSSRGVMIVSSAMAALAGLLALGFGGLLKPPVSSVLMAIPVLVLGVAVAGVRLGRKTYLIDGTPDVDRPLYVAFSNTIIGVLVLAGGGLGFILEWLGVRMLMLSLVILAAGGALASTLLAEAEVMARSG